CWRQTTRVCGWTTRACLSRQAMRWPEGPRNQHWPKCCASLKRTSPNWDGAGTQGMRLWWMSCCSCIASRTKQEKRSKIAVACQGHSLPRIVPPPAPEVMFRPAPIRVTEGIMVAPVEHRTRDILLAEQQKLLDDINSVKAQISDAKARAAATGGYADRDWFSRANFALKKMQQRY